MNEVMPAGEPSVQSVVDRAVRAYFDDCRDRVDDFVDRHFRFPGAWHTNRRALGWDLLRAPLNLFWAPVYLLVLLLANLARRRGWQGLERRLRAVPSGLETRVQRYVDQLIYSELLGRGDGPGQPDRLNNIILEHFDQEVEPETHNREMLRRLEPVVTEAMTHYGLTRTASADIANSLLSAAVGAFVFKKFTPGGIAVGLLLASWLARRQAVESFWLGDFLGSLYYGLFPPQPSLEMNILGILAVLSCLAAFASLSGLITDPVQSWTGLHRRRLHKMIDHLQRDFEARSANTFRPRDPYAARILEIMDAARSHLL